MKPDLIYPVFFSSYPQMEEKLPPALAEGN